MQDNNNMNNMGLTPLDGSLLSEAQALKLGMAICEELAAYSRNNVVHKGVCPDNIFINESGEYTLGQPAVDRVDVAFTAPELIRGGEFDARTDIYSLGMVLAYLTGDDAARGTIAVSDSFREIIRIACAPDPDKRFRDALVMKNALMNLQAAMYFDGVKVSIADEVHEQTSSFSAVRRDIRTTEQDAEKQRVVEDNAKRPVFTAPWDDTMVVNVPGDDIGETVLLSPSQSPFADTVVVPSVDEALHNFETNHGRDYSDTARRNDVINNARAVTDAQRVAFENRHVKKPRKTGSSGKSAIILLVIALALIAVMLFGAIIVGAVFLGDFLIGSSFGDEVKTAQSITVVSEPGDKTYFVGEQINADGIILEVSYDDGSVETVTGGFTLEPSVADKVGTQTVTLKYSGVEVTYEINVVEKQVSSLYLEALPSRREFAAGEAFDLSGMLVDVLYADGSHEMITEGYTYEPAFSAEVGETKIVISYGEKSVSFIVNIVEAAAKRIEVITAPTKLTYNVGEFFDTTGLVLFAEYTNGYTSEVSTGFTVSPEEFTEAGKQTVTVSYAGQSVEFEVEVARANVTRLSVRTMPAKTAYTVGETLSMNGFSMWAYFDNGTSQIITNSYTYTPKTLTKAGTQTVTVTYLGMTASFNVTVTNPAPTVTKITVGSMPKRTEYTVGDTLDTSGLVIIAHYSDGTTKTLTSEYTYSPKTFSSAGKIAVTVRYGKFAAAFGVTVNEPVAIEGACGSKATWSLNGGVLTIKGKGSVNDYSENGTPWSAYSSQIKTVTIESGITSIGAYALANTSVQTLDIPDTLRSFDKTSLYNTPALKYVNLDAANRYFTYKDASLISRDGTTLYAVAFGRFESKYTIPEGITTIAAYRLFANSNIREIVINKDIRSIDTSMFLGAKNLEKITVNSQNTVFVSKDGVLYTKNFNALVCYPIAKAGASFTVPEGVTVIRENAFVNNSRLTSLTLPSTLVRVDANAFIGAAKLSSVTFAGDEAAWKKVNVGAGNDALEGATLKYGS